MDIIRFSQIEANIDEYICLSDGRVMINILSEKRRKY